jgi:MFS family permease
MNQTAPPQRWLIATLLLLSISIFINYIDRGNLSIAAPLIKTEFRLSASQLGFLLTSFFITYTVLQPFVGWLVDTMKPSRVLLAGFAIWSLATIFTGLASTFAQLFALRLALGAGEAVAFPASWKIVCETVDERRRGLANGALFAAMALGPAFGILMGGLLIASFGWRPFFIVFGIVSMLWILPWLKVAPNYETSRCLHHAKPSFKAILKTPLLWAASVGHAGTTYTWYFVLTWIPYYLVSVRHFSISSMAIIGAGVYGLTAIGLMTSGWIADRWIAAGASPTLARNTLVFCGLTGSAIFMLACVASETRASIAYLMLAGLAWGCAPPNVWSAVQTIAGPSATGRWSAIQNTIGSISGIIAPSLTGILVDRTGSFVPAFAVAAAMAIAGACAWLFFVGPVEQIDWSAPAATVRPLWLRRVRVRSTH